MKKKIDFRDGEISFTDKGKGRAVVLLHGFLGSKEIWSEFGDQLAKVFRVISIDLPGHGESDCYGYIHPMELIAKSVKAVMNSLLLKRYVVIGHSMGGYAGLAFAELYFENVKGLCLFHSTAYADSAQKKSDRERAINAVKSNHTLFIKETIANLFSPANAETLKKEISFAQKVARKTSRRGVVASLEGMKARPHRDVILHYAQYPIMMVIGKHDKVLNQQDLFEQAEIIKRKKILVLENSGHMGFLEEPEVCLKEIKRFIRKSFLPLKKWEN
jgi:pimeloyl-ACP methyl ester carboxylesterase